MQFFKKNLENWVYFFVFLIFYLGIAYFFTIILATHHNDTIARSALGYMVIYGRFPKLTNVGFVWTPIISLMQIPLFFPLRMLHVQDLAGTILTAFIGAATIPVINNIGTDLKIDKWLKRTFVILFALNPTIMLYVGVGMSETFFYLPMAFCVLYLVKWMTGKMRYTALVVSGTALAIAFWARYEAIPLMIGICILVVIYTYEHKLEGVSYNHLLESSMITVLLPSFYSIFLWIFFNWTIMGNPMYWWTGEYSNTAYTTVYQAAVNPLFHNLFSSTVYAFQRVIYISPLLIFLSVVGLIMAMQKKSWMPVALIVPSWGLIAFHIYQTYTGTSYGWYRFYAYAIVASVWIFFWLWSFFPQKGYLRLAYSILSILIMIFSAFTTAYAMNQPDLGKEEFSMVMPLTNGGKTSTDELRSFASAKAVDSYFKENHINGPVLMDSFQGFAIILYADNPDIFVKTQDLDFKAALLDPIHFGIKYVLAPKPDDSLKYSEWIYRTFPGIWDSPPNWLKLEKDFGAWRLYKVTAEK